jgi:hypothetical protein
MSDEYKRPAPEDRASARVTRDVAKMSDDERTALAREFARRRGTTPEAPARRAVEKRDPVPPGTPPDEERAEAAARLKAELRSTERHLDRLERAVTAGRHGGGASAPAPGRYDRLLRRADRLERQLRALR